MINLILWLVFGALVGWVASLVMHTDERGLRPDGARGVVHRGRHPARGRQSGTPRHLAVTVELATAGPGR